MAYIDNDSCDGSLGVCADMPHLVLSTDVDDWQESLVTWGLLANHAEYELARPALEEYADETEGVEQLFVRVVVAKSGAMLVEQTKTDIAEMRMDDDPGDVLGLEQARAEGANDW